MFATYIIRTFSVASVALPLLLAGLSLAASATAGPGHQPARPRSTPIGAAPADTTTAAAPALPQVVRLNGLVLNPDGRPCAGASVFPAGAPRQLVVTDAKGAFELPVAAGAALSLQVEYFGVGSSRVLVAKPSAKPLRITLGQ